MDTVGHLFLALGLVVLSFLLAGFIAWYRVRRFIDRSHRAMGVVIKVRKIPFESRDTFAPVVRFTTGDGRALSFIDPVSKYPPEFEVGEQAQVFYDPRDPHRARVVKRLADLFISAKLLGGASAALLAVGLLMGWLWD